MFFLKKLFLTAVFTTITITGLAREITYEVFYGWFSAGRITIDFEPQKVVIKGKSGGMVGIFYHYKLYMVYNLKNETDSFMVEKENSKERKYNFRKILQKKAWLPIVVKLLLEGKNPPPKVAVGTYKVKLKEVDNNTYTYRVEGSKRTKKVILRYWKPPQFPEEIEIETTKGSLTLKRLNNYP